MKKPSMLFISVLLVLSLSACSGSGAESRAAASGTANTVSQVLEDAAQPEETASTQAETAAQAFQTPSLADMELSSEDADIDLTLLSGTMVYAQVSQMMYSPEDYIGMTVKMRGPFAIYEGEERNYYACIIQDATACCANGIEFLWAGEHSYPEDYPELGTEITVVGTFELYEEDGFMYSQLSDAQLSF